MSYVFEMNAMALVNKTSEISIKTSQPLGTSELQDLPTSDNQLVDGTHVPWLRYSREFSANQMAKERARRHTAIRVQTHNRSIRCAF